MNHLEPQPLGVSKPGSKTSSRKQSSKVYVAIAALALILGTGSALTAFFAPASSDDISASTKTQLIAEFAQASPFKLTPVLASEVDTALESMKLSGAQRQELKSSLTYQPSDAGATSSLGWIELWDFASQDGDVVHISSGGYELEYPLLNTPNRLAIPMDASLSVKIQGVSDGGGGITLGLRSGAVSISLPVIQPGQVLTVPLTY